MKKSLIASLIGISLLSTASLASASTIYSGSVIDATPSACCSLTASLLLDQSGLSNNYISGVTNFETYTASNPSHLGTSGTPSTSGYFAQASAFIDIDLGTTLTLTKLALWNDNDYQGVKNFNLLISDNPLFAGATSLGSFTATYGVSNTFLDYQIGTDVQLFDLIDATGRYVRVNFVDAHQDQYINVGEIAFGAGSTIQQIPEPASLALLGLGLAGLGFSRRKKA